MGTLRIVALVKGRVAAGLRLGRRIGHVLHVALPGETLGRELAGDRRYGRRIYAEGSSGLSIRARHGGDAVEEHRTVRLGGGVRRLPADHGHVVVQAVVADPVVLVEVLTHGRELGGRGGRLGGRAEGGVVRFVLEHDHEHVLDVGQSGGNRRRRRGQGGTGLNRSRGRGQRGHTAGEGHHHGQPVSHLVTSNGGGRRGFGA